MTFLRRNDDAKIVRAFGDGRRYLPANPQRRGQGSSCPDLLRRGLISGIPGTQSAAGADFCGKRLLFGGKLPGFKPLEFEGIGNEAGRNSYFPSAGE